jgi:uncharacterized protein (DUF1330 family)
LGPFRQASGPLTLKAGAESLAAGDPSLHVLEGTWSHTGTIVMERYPSMDGLLTFWNSREYQDARKLVANAASSWPSRQQRPPAGHAGRGPETRIPDRQFSADSYRSMDDLLAFWNSPDYEEAKKLRAGMVEMNFIVAIEGR